MGHISYPAAAEIETTTAADRVRQTTSLFVTRSGGVEFSDPRRVWKNFLMDSYFTFASLFPRYYYYSFISFADNEELLHLDGYNCKMK